MQYHVAIESSDGWYVGRVLERGGITTQGRTLDELVLMVRDAILTMWGERNVELEFLVGSKLVVQQRRTATKRRRIA